MGHKIQTTKPGNPLNQVKMRIQNNDILIRPNAIESAWNDFGWDSDDIKKCLLRLNDRNHRLDPNNNHFYKYEVHSEIPHAIMDYYKANNIMDGENVYTHFYIHPGLIKVVVSSFKKL